MVVLPYYLFKRGSSLILPCNKLHPASYLEGLWAQCTFLWISIQFWANSYKLSFPHFEFKPASVAYKSPVFLVRQLCFWRFPVNYLTVFCWFFSVQKQTNFILVQNFFFSVCWLKKKKSTNNCRIIDWKTSET